MLIACEAANGELSQLIPTVWAYDPESPWVVHVAFIGHTATWEWSLELLKEALSGEEGIHYGSGDVTMQRIYSSLIVMLDVPEGSVDLYFNVDQVEEFLSQIDDSNAEMIIGQQLDEWLETL